MPKMSGYVNTFKVEERNNKSMDDEKLLEKYKAIWTQIEDLGNIKLNALSVYDDRYIKTKIRKYNDKIYTNLGGLNVPEDDIYCESFTAISIDSLLVYDNRYYLQEYLDNFAYKIANKQMTYYLDENFLKVRFYKCGITIELIMDLGKKSNSKECMIFHYLFF